MAIDKKSLENVKKFEKEFKGLLEKYKVSINLESDYNSTDVNVTFFNNGYYTSKDDKSTGFDIPLLKIYNEINSKFELCLKD